MTQTMSHQALTSPGEAAAENGQVVLDGPDGVTATMTPDAAEETGRRLIAAAAEAREQRA
ncbi:hypothetical protein [Sphingomonas bacterium]|uniref:hypothetical protein n=1 Tax=Sphingomonas bacterium TaxID=1895847 RepID=UPI0015776FAB|nr:hypothetical protein [Sphingomonas bacterium]